MPGRGDSERRGPEVEARPAQLMLASAGQGDGILTPLSPES